MKLTFINFLIETIAQPVQYKWDYKQSDIWRASFTANDIKYIVIFQQDDESNTKWDVAFDVVGNTEPFSLTGTGNSFVVFSTIREILLDFIKTNKNVNTMYYSAKEESRKKFYTSFSKKLLPDLPGSWELKMKDRGSRFFYFIRQR